MQSNPLELDVQSLSVVVERVDAFAVRREAAGVASVGVRAEPRDVEMSVAFEDLLQLLGQPAAIFQAGGVGQVSQVQITASARVIMGSARLQEAAHGALRRGPIQRIRGLSG